MFFPVIRIIDHLPLSYSSRACLLGSDKQTEAQSTRNKNWLRARPKADLMSNRILIFYESVYTITIIDILGPVKMRAENASKTTTSYKSGEGRGGGGKKGEMFAERVNTNE